MKIILVNEHIFGQVSGEETLWSFLGKHLPGATTLALKDSHSNFEEYLEQVRPDVVIYHSLLGNLAVPLGVKKVVLLQDNFISMDKILPKTFRQLISQIVKRGNSFFRKSILKQKEALNNADKVVSVSESVAKVYEVKGEVIPIGVDPELFHPMDRKEVRRNYGIKEDAYVKIFVGSTHKVKGFDLILQEIKDNPEHLYILVLKDKEVPRLELFNVKVYNRISQTELAKLYNCADIYVGRSRVETLWLAPIEAMFCDIPIDVTPVGIFESWTPKNKDPRAEAFEMGLSQDTMVKRWQELLTRI